MRSKIIALSAALVLAACSGVAPAVQQADTTIAAPQTQADITLACAAVQVADAGFQIAVKAGYVDAGGLAIEKAAMASIAAACLQPYPQNTADVIKLIFATAAQVSGLTATAHATLATQGQ